MDLTEKQLDSRVVYNGGFIEVLKDAVQLPDGSRSTREYITHPGAVAMLALLDNGKLVMERQYRYPLHREFIELPAGKIDEGEDILVTAQRELLEETAMSRANGSISPPPGRASVIPTSAWNTSSRAA